MVETGISSLCGFSVLPCQPGPKDTALENGEEDKENVHKDDEEERGNKDLYARLAVSLGKNHTDNM